MSKSRIIIAGAALAAFTVLGGATAASAAVHNGTCESGELCGYNGTNKGGAMNDWTNSVDNTYNNDYLYLTNHDAYTTAHDTVTSVWNRRTPCYHLYKNTNQGGNVTSIGPGGASDSFKNLSSGFTNTLDSHASYSC